MCSDTAASARSARLRLGLVQRERVPIRVGELARPAARCVTHGSHDLRAGRRELRDDVIDTAGREVKHENGRVAGLHVTAEKDQIQVARDHRVEPRMAAAVVGHAID